MAEYYLSNGGNDTLTGADIANAWETITKLNTDVTESVQGLEPADAVRLDRGSGWEETLNLPTQNDGSSPDPVSFAPYGTGDNPVISGLKKLTGWTNVSGNLYRIQDASFVDSLQFIFEGDHRMKGRLPAIGSAPPNDTLPYISAGTTTLEASNLPSIDYSGGEVVAFVEKNDWIHDKSYISGRSGNVLTVAQASGYTGTQGQYYIENAIEALQADGDWMYSPSLQEYTIYSTVHPDTLDIYVPVRATNVNAQGNHYNTFEDIVFQGSHDIGILANSSYYNIFQNLLIRHQANIAMQLLTAKYSEIRNVTFENILNQGAEIINDSDFTVVEENTFRNIGMLLGYSGSGDLKGSALFFRSNLDGGYICRLNLFEDIGYLGIRFHGDDALVEKNILRRYCMVKHDGAGIYTWGGAPGATLFTNRIVRKNLLLDGGSRARDAVYSIYIDDNSENVLIELCGIIRTRRAGYYNHNSNNIQFRNNIVYAADMAYFFAQDNLGGVISDNEVSSNVFVITSKNHQAARLISDEDNLSTFLSLVDNNEYIVCCGQQIVFATQYVQAGKLIFDNLTFAQWQAQGNDVNSSVRYLNIPEYTINSEGPNKYTGDGTFEGALGNVSVFHKDGTASVSQDTTGKITGTGSLKCSVSVQSATTTRTEVAFRNLGVVDSTKKYIVRFKALATSGHQSLVIYARQSGAPYKQLGSNIYAVADNTVRQFEFLLTELIDDDNAALLIDMQAHQGDLYIDDFEFREAVVEMTDIEESIRVFYNDQDSLQDVAIPGTWKDLGGTEYTDTISLTGFESKVLEYVSGAAPEPGPVTTPGGLIAGRRFVSLNEHYGQSVYDAYVRAKANNAEFGASLMDVKPIADKILAHSWDMVNVPVAYKDNALYSLIGPDLIVSGGGNGSRWDKDGLLITGLPNDRPRFTFDPSDIGKFEGLFLEVGKFNYAKNSNGFFESFDQGSKTLNAAIGIDGTNSSTLLNVTRDLNVNPPILWDAFTRFETFTVGETFSLTFWVRLGTALNLVLTYNNTTGWASAKDIYTNILDETDGLTVSDFVKVETTFQIPSTGKINAHFGETGYTPNIGIQEPGNLYFDSFQFEAGNPTSYIKTTSSNVYRPTDTLQATGLINTASPYSIFEIRNGLGVLKYTDPGAGTVRTYIDGQYIGEDAAAVSADLLVNSQGSDKLLGVAYHSGSLTEQERLARSGLFL